MLLSTAWHMDPFRPLRRPHDSSAFVPFTGQPAPKMQRMSHFQLQRCRKVANARETEDTYRYPCSVHRSATSFTSPILRRPGLTIGQKGHEPIALGWLKDSVAALHLKRSETDGIWTRSQKLTIPHFFDVRPSVDALRQHSRKIMDEMQSNLHLLSFASKKTGALGAFHTQNTRHRW